MTGGTGGILLLLVGLYLLVAFLGGRLEWLFSLGKQVGDARTDSNTPQNTVATRATAPRPTSTGRLAAA